MSLPESLKRLDEHIRRMGGNIVVSDDGIDVVMSYANARLNIPLSLCEAIERFSIEIVEDPKNFDFFDSADRYASNKLQFMLMVNAINSCTSSESPESPEPRKETRKRIRVRESRRIVRGSRRPVPRRRSY